METQKIYNGFLVSWLTSHGFDYIAIETIEKTDTPYALYKVTDELEKAIKDYEVINAGLALVD